MKSVDPAPIPVNLDVIRVLEDILDCAKRGEISDVAVYVKCYDY